MEEKAKSRVTKVVEFFSSLRITLVLLILLGLLCALGTLVPMTDDYGDFRRFLIGGVGRLMLALSLHEPFSSPLFRLVLAFLALNLGFCTFKRLPSLLRSYLWPKANPGRGAFERAKLRANGGHLPSRGLEEIFSESSYELLAQSEEEDGSRFFFLRRSSFAPFGPSLTHLGILLLFLGGVLGWMWGFEGYAEAAVGDSFSVYPGDYYRIEERLRDLEFLEDFYFDLEKEELLRKEDVKSFKELQHEKSRLFERRELLSKKPRFSVRVLAAQEERYSDDDASVKDWKSLLQVERDGEVLAKKSIEVNSPMEFAGVNMYQHTFSHRPDDDGSLGSMIAKAELALGNTKSFPSIPLTIRLLDYYPDFAIGPGEDGRPEAFSKSREANNPAIKLELSSKGQEDGRRVFLFPKPPYVVHSDSSDPFKLRLVDFSAQEKIFTIAIYESKRRAWTGISLQYDPGVSLIFLASVLIVLGMVLSFYFEERKICLWLKPDGELCLLGKAAKFPNLFLPEFETMASRFSATVHFEGRKE